LSRTIRTLLLASMLLSGPWPAKADVILTQADGGAAFVGPVEGGFTVSGTGSTMIYALDPSNGVYSGLGAGAAWTVRATDGGSFTFAGLDALALGWPANRVDISLTGLQVGGGAIVADLSAPGSALLPASLAGVALSSLTIAGFGYDDGGFAMTSGFNNVTVNEIANPGAFDDPLPEPGSVAVLAVSLSGIALVRRGRRAS
jgi:hypothetical protein